MTDLPSDSIELVRRAQQGDDAALNRLFERYQERVRRVVRLRLGSRLRGLLDSGDILQETMLEAFKRFDRYELRDEASFLHWLCRLAQSQIAAAADHHSAQKRDADRNVPLPPDSVAPGGPGGGRPVADPRRVPLEQLSEAEQAAILDQCLGELRAELRELVILRDFMGGSWEMVARECGRPSPAAARMMHARAIVELGKCLERRGVGGDWRDGRRT